MRCRLKKKLKASFSLESSDDFLCRSTILNIEQRCLCFMLIRSTAFLSRSNHLDALGRRSNISFVFEVTFHSLKQQKIFNHDSLKILHFKNVKLFVGELLSYSLFSRWFNVNLWCFVQRDFLPSLRRAP